MSNFFRGESCHQTTVENVKNFPIGMFDSGLGGLTVLRELYRQLPNESILYFGDTARLPYGTRSQTEIIQFVRDIIAWMTLKGVKMVIMACNTSSALALDTIRSEFDIPILGLILPGARAAVGQGKRIGVIATPATTASNAYKQAMLEIDPAVTIWQVSCPEFVPLIEQGRIHDPLTLQVVRGYIDPLLALGMDALVYGCTHYPHLAPILKTLLPPSVTTVDPAVYVVHSAVQELDSLNLRNSCSLTPSTHFYVSGSGEHFAQLALPWLGYLPKVDHVKLSRNSAVEHTGENSLKRKVVTEKENGAPVNLFT